MKRFLAIVLAAMLLLTALGGCAKDSGRPFDYDLSKYITLGEFIGVEYTYNLKEVDDEAVESYVNSALAEKGYGETKDVTDRAAKNGDTVNIDFVGTIDGVAFEGGSSTGFDLTLGTNTFIDGFEAGLVGAEKGEKRDLNLKFPEDYGNDELNGKDVVFSVTVNSIKTTVYPKLNDALVKELSDKTSVDEYLTYVKGEVKTQNEEAAVNDMENQIWSKIVNDVKVTSLPEKEIENYKKILLESYDSITQQQYGMTYEEYLKQATGKTLEDEEIQKNLTLQAETAVKEYMTIVAIARDQDLDITDEEYAASVEKYAKNNGYSDSKEFLEAVDEGQFYLSLLIEKVMDFVVDNAKEVTAQ